MKPHSLYRHFNEAGDLLYVGVAMNAVKRLAGHRHGSSWFREISKVTIEWLETKEAALAAERKAIQEEKPRHNVMMNPLVERKAVLYAFGDGKKRLGRKPVKAGEETVTFACRMGKSQREKFRALGGAAWVRSEIESARIDRAKLKGSE